MNEVKKVNVCPSCSEVRAFQYDFKIRDVLGSRSLGSRKAKHKYGVLRLPI
jgi:hypothetical protein